MKHIRWLSLFVLLIIAALACNVPFFVTEVRLLRQPLACSLWQPRPLPHNNRSPAVLHSHRLLKPPPLLQL